MSLWAAVAMGCVVGVVVAVLHMAGFYYYQRRGEQRPWLRYFQR